MPKPTPEKIRAILEDLYTLDPTLRAHGGELEQVVTSLLAAKPDISVDQRFVQSLRKKLLTSDAPVVHPQTLMEKLSLKFLLPTAAVATVAVAVAVVMSQPGLLSPSPRPVNTGATPSLLASGLTVSREEANAFGSLSGNTSGMGMGGDAAISARSQSGGGYGGGGGIPPASPMPADASANKVAGEAYAVSEPTSLIAPAPDYTYERIRYVYDGPELQLESSGSVYRRVKAPLTGSNLGSVLNTLSLGVVDLQRFGSLNLQQFSLAQPGEFGHQIYVDMVEGAININENYNTWPHPEYACRDEACFARYRLTESNIPEDAALIAMADAFLSDHGIPKDPYGTPVVDRRWNTIMPFARSSVDPLAVEDAKRLMAPMYVPEVVTVMYPLKLDETMVKDQSGFAYGLSVSVNIRHKRVSSVWNLTTQQYQSSSYDLVTDAKQVLDYASRGDQYSPAFGQDPNERVRELKLGEPERILMQSWHQKEDGTGEELMVPALRFPVIADATGYMGYRDSIVVPLVKDLLTPAPTLMYSGMGGGTPSSGMKVEVSNPPAATMTAPAAMDAPTTDIKR